MKGHGQAAVDLEETRRVTETGRRAELHIHEVHS